MGQYNIYAADDELNIDVNVEPLTLDTLENSKTAAEASAETARQCAETATEALNDITDYKNSLELYYAQASDNLTTLLNNSLASLNFCKQGIQTLGNTVLSSINSAYNSIVEYIQTLGQGYVNQAKYYADEARDTVDNRVSLEHLNQSKALETGDVSDDSAVLHQLNRFACSTFDNTKFTVVGSPVITDDGIASGFSSSNFLRTPTIDFSKPFEIIFEEKFITRPTGLYSNLLNIQGMTSGNNIGYYIQAKLASDSFAGIFNMIVNNTIHWEFIKFLWTGEQYKIYLKENANADWVLRSTYDSTIPPSTANNTTTAILVAGYNQNSVYSADGSIDLNAFKIYVDGNLVYQPCLKIPYTEAKTGSKIVDSIYRDRVNDMAEQYGYANYYTLDEENGNFTLPMGEVYGMIGHNSSSIDTLETGKADTDLSNINPTQTAKNTILGWGMPDYANGVEITAQPFVAPSAGYIVGHAYRAGTTATKAYINSVEIGHEENDYIDIQMLMNTGDEYSDNANSRELTFLPLMGV